MRPVVLVTYVPRHVRAILTRSSRGGQVCRGSINTGVDVGYLSNSLQIGHADRTLPVAGVALADARDTGRPQTPFRPFFAKSAPADGQSQQQ
jgi:hypothetical protein